MSDLVFTPASDLARQIRNGQVSALEVVDAHLQRITARNDRTNAYCTILDDAARDAAKQTDRAIAAGDDPGPLSGVPVAIKDLTAVAGARTTYGSVPLAGHVPEADAPTVERLRSAGAIILGKTNTSEFGHIATTDNELFGATGTPFDPTRTAGGSSGGSAAAVADGMAPLALGSDYGGSIRIPAACCGVYGFKPTFGRVPRHTRPDAFVDIYPFSSDGPIARTVEDAALMLDVTAGVHRTDPYSIPNEERHLSWTTHPVEDLTVGVSPDLGVFHVDDRVRGVLEEAVATLTATGMTVERADTQLETVWEDMQAASRTIFQSRMAQIIELSPDAFGIDLAAHESELTHSFRRMGELGREFSAVDLGRANATRTRLYDTLQSVFADFDLLATPTIATPPFAIDEIGPDVIDGERIDPYTGWYLTQPFNMTGGPAASIPAGFVGDLPIGLQLAGPRHADEAVIAASSAFERESPWHHAYPP